MNYCNLISFNFKLRLCALKNQGVIIELEIFTPINMESHSEIKKDLRDF